MEFHPELDYDGEIENRIKVGYGNFAWPNGNRFEDMWVNNERNGKGKLYVKGGSVVDGHWKDDKLDGEAILKTSSGQVIETRIYKASVLISKSKPEDPKG